MTYEDAMKRLAGCRALQPTELQVIVSADVVDALLSGPRSADARCQMCRDCGAAYCTDCASAVFTEHERRVLGL